MSSITSSQSISLHFLLNSSSDGSAHQHSHWCLNEELRCFCWIWGGLQHPQVNGQRLEARGIVGSFFIFPLSFSVHVFLTDVLVASPWMSLPVWHLKLRWTLRTTQMIRLSAMRSCSSPLAYSDQLRCFSVSLNIFSCCWICVDYWIFDGMLRDIHTVVTSKLISVVIIILASQTSKSTFFVRPAAFPSIATLLVRLPSKKRDDMNHFFIGTIQKIIKQREEQPPELVNLTHLGPGNERQIVN